MKTDPRRRERATYRFWTQVVLRFSDMDVMGHVNNVAFVSFYQEARVRFHQYLYGKEAASADADRLILAHLSVDFLREAHHPGTVDIGLGVLRTGRTSYTLAMAMFEGDECLGLSDAVMVTAGAAGPEPIRDDVRGRLAAMAARVDDANA
jgi:acyl-CoA thioester hydrolase